MSVYLYSDGVIFDGAASPEYPARVFLEPLSYKERQTYDVQDNIELAFIHI